MKGCLCTAARVGGGLVAVLGALYGIGAWNRRRWEMQRARGDPGDPGAGADVVTGDRPQDWVDSDCCGGTGMSAAASIPCENPECPVPLSQVPIAAKVAMDEGGVLVTDAEEIELTEVRYYIGTWGEFGRMCCVLDPTDRRGATVRGVAVDPRNPLPVGVYRDPPDDEGPWLYPVSRQVAEAFMRPDDDEDEDEDALEARITEKGTDD